MPFEQSNTSYSPTKKRKDIHHQPDFNQGINKGIINQPNEYKFVTFLTEEDKNDSEVISCPVEDPRNPYHKEYLRLIELSREFEISQQTKVV